MNIVSLRHTFCSVLTLTLVLTLLVSHHAMAQETAESLARAYVDAINQSSRGLITKLIHPACPVGLISWDEVDRVLEMNVPEEYEIKVVDLAEVSGTLEMALPALESNAVVMVSFDGGDGSTETLTNFAAVQDGTWHLVLCHKAEAEEPVQSEAVQGKPAAEMMEASQGTALAAEPKEERKGSLRRLPSLSSREVEQALAWTDEVAYFVSEKTGQVILRVKSPPLPNWAVAKVSIFVDSVMTADGQDVLDRKHKRAKSYVSTGVALDHVVRLMGVNNGLRIYTTAVDPGTIEQVAGKMRVRIPRDVKAYFIPLRDTDVTYNVNISGTKVSFGTNARKRLWVKWPEELHRRAEFHAYDAQKERFPRGKYEIFREGFDLPVTLSRSYDEPSVSAIEILEGDNFIEKTIPFTASRRTK